MGSRGREDEGTMGGEKANETGENGPVVSSRAAGEPVWMPFQLTWAASQRQSPSFFLFFCSLGEHISHCLWALMSRGWKNKEEEYGPRIQKSNTSSQDKDREGLRVLPLLFISPFSKQ